MALEQGERHSKRLMIGGGIVTGIYFFGAVGLMIANWGDFKWLTFNELGDFLAGVFAPLAFLWLVLGYFQQGQELRLNTEVLKSQQEELRRQVEETAVLAKSAQRQADATEVLTHLTRAGQAHNAAMEATQAQPDIFFRGTDVSGANFKIKLDNRGPLVTDLVLRTIKGSYELSLQGGRSWETGRRLEIHATQTGPDQPYPCEFELAYNDGMGIRRYQRLLWAELQVVKTIKGRSQAATDSKNGDSEA